MSLLDDVSIVVTPNGYKAGELYAVVPVPTEGSEEITNGDFATDSDWGLGTGWSISGGTANCIGGAGSLNLTQVALEIGKRYTVTYTVLNYSQGTVQVKMGGWTQGTLNTSNGTYTEVISNDHPSANTTIYIQGKSDFIGSIDNVSVKEYTAADMDVTRATAATRVDEAGLVNYAEILGSEEVTNGNFTTDLSGWTISGTDATHTVTWTASGARFQSDTTSPVLQLSQSILTIGKTYKLTCNIAYASGETLRCNFGGINQSAFTEGANVRLVTATNTNFIFLRNTSNVDAIISNVIIKEVTRDNVPRIDYTGGGCPHILAEPESTNHCTFSEQPSVWTSSTGVTVTANATTSPEGTANASTVVNTATNAFVRNAFLYTSTDASLNVTTSFFLKYTNNQWVSLKPNFFTGGSNSKTWFDIQNGVLGTNDNVSSSIVDFGNGWYRCSVTHQIAPATDTSGFVFIYAVDNDNSTTQVIGQGFAAFGSQGEQLSYSTSYIPTSGSTVTRVQDQFTRDGIGSLINSTEGVLFVELSALANDGLSKRITLADGSISNRVSLELDETANKIKAFITSGGISQILEYTAPNLLQFNKIAVKWKLNDFAIWFNGNEVATDTLGNAPTGVNELSFNDGQGGSNFFGKVKQLQVYKTALGGSPYDATLSDARLAALTSL